MRDNRRQIVDDLLGVLRSHELATLWTSFESGSALIAEVERIAVELPDASAVNDLTVLFAPTGVLQDVALDSGFHDEYVLLADRHDKVQD